MQVKIKRLLIIFYMMLFYVDVSAHADYANKKKEKYSLSIGPLALMIPRYDGASSYRFLVVPNFNFRYKNNFSISPYRGLGFNFSDLKPLSFNVGARYKFWFRSKRSDIFPGIVDLKPYFEGYLIAKYAVIRPVIFSIGLYHSLNKLYFGGFMIAGVNYFTRITEKLNVFCGPNIKISNTKHMRTLYSVSKAESKLANISEYELSGGVENIRFNTGISYKLNEKWSSHFMFSIKRILFDAAKSPLIKNKYQYFANLSLSRKF